MVLPVDAKHAFRFPSELQRLAAAIRDAAATDESDWIEWKSELELLTPAADQVISRNVIAFANRNPTQAGLFAEGYGYLVVGVEPHSGAEPRPGSGVRMVDLEKLIPRLRSYIGDRIQWRVEPCELDEKSILFIIVDPPKEGDPINALQKEIGKYQEGTIFVRRQGHTVRASQTEIDMLARRASAQMSSLQIDLSSARDFIERFPDVSGIAKEWLKKERKEVLAAYAPKSDSEEKEITLRLHAGERALSGYLERLLRCRRLNTVSTVIRNDTEQNYTAVQLLLYIEGSAKILEDVNSDAIWTSTKTDIFKPLPRERFPGYGSAGKRFQKTSLYQSDEKLHVGSIRWSMIQLENRIETQFENFDVRSGSFIRLPAFPLLLVEHPDASIEIQWRATAANTAGYLNGSFTINVLDSTFDFGAEVICEPWNW